MSKVLAVIALLLCVQAARADFMNGDFENTTLINQLSWTAGTDQVNQWYGGPDLAIAGPTGGKYLANQNTVTDPTFASIRDSLQAMAIPAAGTYALNASFQAGSDYNDQYFGFNILLAKPGVVIPLTGAGYYMPASMLPPAGSVDILDVDPGDGTGGTFDSAWHNIATQSFTITPDQASQYSYMLIYTWANRSADPAGDQTSSANSDNYSTDAVSAPEPATMSLLLLGGLAMLRRKK